LFINIITILWKYIKLQHPHPYHYRNINGHKLSNAYKAFNSYFNQPTLFRTTCVFQPARIRLTSPQFES